jgi:predicted P-loop ATPase
MNPGAQVDHMLILEGDQAARKSTTARILGGEWYSGELPSLMDAERAGQAIQGAWIIEAAELDALQGAHAARVKDFLTKTSDRYRAPWTRHHVDRPRQCVFIGTTNEGSYISDPTGARRYWPVRVEECDTVALATDRDQLWAEAVHAWSNGEAWWPEKGHTVERQLRIQQRERQTGDVWEQYIGDYVRGQDTVTTADILTDCLGIDPGKQTRKEYERVNGILRLNGWHAARVTAPDGSRRRGWKRPL